MKRKYQSRRRKTDSNQSNSSEQESSVPKTNIDINTNTKASPIIHKYQRKFISKSPKRLASNLSQSPTPTKARHTYNLRSNRITSNDSRDSSIDSTTSFLSALSLKKSSRKPKKSKCTNKPIIIDNEAELTLDDICNDAVDIKEQYFDPESIAYDDTAISDWPSWVSKKDIMHNKAHESPSRKRKRNITNHNDQSPPSKKQKSPLKIFSTVRKNKRRARRRSSVANSFDLVTPCKHTKGSHYDVETPIASIRTQRIHRLTRKSNTDLLFDVLLKETECDQLLAIKQQMKAASNKSKAHTIKLTLKDLNGLKAVGKMDKMMERLCVYLLSFGADPLLLNSDGVNAIYIAMHYKNNHNVISAMINKCIMSNYEELNQTYIFAEYGTISLLDIALRVKEVKTVKLLLENCLMPTRHSVDYAPKVELITFCKQHRITKLGCRVLKEQLFEAVDNLDIEYIESIICHGMDVNAKIQTSKSSLYYLVQQPFDIYDELDAKDQYDTIVCLLKHGANPNYVDASKTPMLIHPMQRSGRWNIKLVDILLHYGTNLKSKVGDTKKSLYVYAKENCVCDQILKVITSYYNNKKKVNKVVIKSRNGIANKKAKKVKVKDGNGSESKKCVKRKQVKKEAAITKIELNVTTNTELTSNIKTKNVVKKNYQRQRKSAKVR